MARSVIFLYKILKCHQRYTHVRVQLSFSYRVPCFFKGALGSKTLISLLTALCMWDTLQRLVATTISLRGSISLPPACITSGRLKRSLSQPCLHSVDIRSPEACQRHYRQLLGRMWMRHLNCRSALEPQITTINHEHKPREYINLFDTMVQGVTLPL